MSQPRRLHFSTVFATQRGMTLVKAVAVSGTLCTAQVSKCQCCCIQKASAATAYTDKIDLPKMEPTLDLSPD